MPRQAHESVDWKRSVKLGRRIDLFEKPNLPVLRKLVKKTCWEMTEWTHTRLK